ncbi:MAG: hypothetical protein L3J39_02180 [Verrucomicrobiales bacterium]|nr:hypothetical protein [Verrucomicrobiales bacterium]
MRKLSDIDFTATADFPWLGNLGGQFEPDEPFVQIKDQSEAIDFITSEDYEYFQIDLQNDLTIYLDDKHHVAYQRWNENIIFIKQQLAPQFKNIEDIVERHGLPKTVADSIGWDIMHSYQEWVYGDGNIPIYYTKLLPIYRTGHLVCGYRGSLPDFQILTH